MRGSCVLEGVNGSSNYLGAAVEGSTWRGRGRGGSSLPGRGFFPVSHRRQEEEES